MKKALVLTFGIASYGLFFGVFLYMIGFIGNAFVPRSIDVGPEAPFGFALLINSGLVLLFGLQHSIMARPAFKRVWTQIIPEAIERSTYVLASSLALIALFYFWRPMPLMLWDFTGTTLGTIGWIGFGAGWVLLLISTFLVNHFDLFGLRQVVNFSQGRTPAPLKFAKRGFYKFARHPIYLSWLIITWTTPAMSVGHLVYAIGMTVYMFVAIPFEERDLVEEHGETYRRYQESTPMVIPGIGAA